MTYIQGAITSAQPTVNEAFEPLTLIEYKIADTVVGLADNNAQMWRERATFSREYERFIQIINDNRALIITSGLLIEVLRQAVKMRRTMRRLETLTTTHYADWNAEYAKLSDDAKSLPVLRAAKERLEDARRVVVSTTRA